MDINKDVRRNAVLEAMAAALPAHKKDDETSDMSSSYEVIALLMHAYLTTLGFRLIGLNKNDLNVAGLMATDSFATTLARQYDSTVSQLPPSWNASFGSHTFMYRAPDSPVQSVMTVERMPTDRTRVQVRGSVIGSDKWHTLEAGAPRDIIVSSMLPLRIKMEETGEDRISLPAQLHSLFVSDTVIDDEPARPNPYPAPDILDAPRNTPRPIPTGELAPPGFDDEHEIQGPLRPLHAPSGLGLGGRGGLGMGHDDLNPPGLGPQDPLRQSFVPGGGFGRQTGGHRGMHPTMDELMFPNQSGDFSSGGDMFNPQVPPGARWDPTGPGGRPGRNNGGFGGGFGGGGPII
ncbi:PI31 proteasome regulator [Ceratocystis lukuohia]|uniref:PI31 proteasome regulator n=1 Tax=Ceratocystis lukuohia TaxID=2019550 RepID=A0ABR4MPW9_9PEZI